MTDADVITLAEERNSTRGEPGSILFLSPPFFLPRAPQLHRSVSASLLATWRASRQGSADGGGQATVSGYRGEQSVPKKKAAAAEAAAASERALLDSR